MGYPAISHNSIVCLQQSKMAAMVGGKYYHRRLDRGPEKADFYLLPEDDRRLISNLRYSMEGAREKITKLRDVLDNK